MRSRFVRPETRRIALADDAWIVVRQRLTAGEEHALHGREMEYVNHEWRLNVTGYQLARVLAYLLDWSFTDEAGARVEILGQPYDVVAGAVRNLTGEAFTELYEAIERHKLAIDAEREAEKKTPTGTPEWPAISPSLAGVGGGTSG